jgi:chromosome partitioning protein
MRKILVLNQKGGVGKTTSVVNLGACLAEKGRKVLLVDVDPQAHLSIHYGIEVPRGEPSLYTVLRGETSLAETVRDTDVPGVQLLPANIDLSGLSVELSGDKRRLFKMREAFKQVPAEFDYVIMDSPPSLGLLTVNALCAAREVFIPLQTEFFALQGLSKLLQTVRKVQQKVNRKLRITGVLAVMHDARTNLATEILADIRGHFGARVFDTVVRKNIRLAEAPGFGQPIIEYDQSCYGSQDYRSLAAEVIGMERRNGSVASTPHGTA